MSRRRKKFAASTLTVQAAPCGEPFGDSPRACELNYLATLGEDVEEAALTPDEPVDDHHPLVLAVQDCPAALAQRSKSESFICTAQGIVFDDSKSQYQARLSKIVALAANANSLGSHSNVLLAKKALRYRKVMERRRILEL
ncbi:unnamed protein product [Phytophthora lilii]|uniref:Unnamed protein product n=1 Tax=Phytophthora lilii TaxID=2077276 RepID=A0A9W6X3D7_9STRA|nr:unnamed protein product [Phytophthora lilii]